MKKDKTAIICMGGGMRSAHGAGFLYVLALELGITSPDIIIGSSGDAGNVLYYAAGQYNSGKRIWRELLSTRKFIFLLRFWRPMNIDYLIDTVFKKQEPLNIEQLQKSPVNWFISVTNTQTGEPRYIGKDDHIDPFEILRASKALPIFFRKRITLEGKKYFDGEFGPRMVDHINHARKNGAKKILILSDASPHTLLSKTVMEAYALTTPPPLRDALIQDISTESVCLSLPDTTIVCVIAQKLPASSSTRNQKKLRATFERGAQDARAMKESLHTLFG